MLERKYLDREKHFKKDPRKHEVLQFKKNNKFIFAIICKKDIANFTSLEDMQICIKNLRQELHKENVDSSRISRDPYILDESFWRKTKNELRTIFENSKIKLTICENILPVPRAEKRRDIIAEFHISTLAGHKGRNRTFSNIAKRYYWRHLHADVNEYVKRC